MDAPGKDEWIKGLCFLLLNFKHFGEAHLGAPYDGSFLGGAFGGWKMLSLWGSNSQWFWHRWHDLKHSYSKRKSKTFQPTQQSYTNSKDVWPIKKTIYIYSFWEISTFLLPPQNTQPFSPRETTWAKKNIVTIWVKTCCYSFCARLPPSTTAPWSGKPVIATRSNEGRSNPLGKLPGIGGVFVGGGATVWMYKTL